MGAWVSERAHNLALESPVSTAAQVLERSSEGWFTARVGDQVDAPSVLRTLSGAIRDVFGDNRRKV